MSTQTIIIIAAVLAVLLVAAAGLRSGPRVTQIDRTIRKEKDADDA